VHNVDPYDSEAKGEEQDCQAQASQNSSNTKEQSVQGCDEADDDDIEADDESVESDVNTDNQRTESRDEDHNGGKDFSDGRNNAGKDSSDGGFRCVTLLESSGPSLRIGIVDGADELVDERLSLGGAGRGVRGDTLELGSDAVDCRLEVGDDGISRDRALLSIPDGVGGDHQTEGQGGKEERGGASEQHYC